VCRLVPGGTGSLLTELLLSVITFFTIFVEQPGHRLYSGKNIISVSHTSRFHPPYLTVVTLVFNRLPFQEAAVLFLLKYRNG